MEKGFFYISYYDKAIESGMAVFTGEPATNYNRIYQYDPLGATDYLVFQKTTGGASYAANVFTAVGDDYLTAVSFYNRHNSEGTAVDYQIKIYLDPPDGAPCALDTMPAAAVKLSLIVEGYYTVKLPNKVPLTKGQKFSVVLSGLVPAGNWGASVPIERPIPSNHLGGATANPGESYVSPDGANWQDLTTVEVNEQGNMVTLENTNACIKAFTTPKVSLQAWKAEKFNNLAWSVTNASATATSVKPVAQLYRKTKTGFAKFGGEVTADYYLDRRGIKHGIRHGWVEVPPGGAITVYSRHIPAVADRVGYNYYSIDPSNRSNRLIRLSDVWRSPPLWKSTPRGFHRSHE